LQTFLQSPAAWAVDAVAQRYGLRPSALLDGDYGDFLEDLLVADVSAKHEQQMIDEAKAKG